MDLHPVRLLIVDDDIWFRDGIKRFVRDATDITIVGESENGREALDLLRNTDVDVVLCDLMMPEVDGAGVLRALTASPAPPRVVMVTAFDTAESLVEALTLGAVGYVSKSDSPSLIVETIRRAGRQEGPHVAPRHVQRLVDLAGERPAQRLQHPAFELLTPREREVYELVVQGMSNAEIANRLHYSEITIRKRVSSILAKFDLPSRSRLIALSHD